jgi:hypothetical protein
MAVPISSHTPDRLPALSPARLPAAETSWHGKPAHRTSTGSTPAQSVSVMSPRFFTAGKWWARIAAAPGSLSATQASSPPSTDSMASQRPS